MKTSKKIVDSWLIASYRAGDNTALSLLVKRWHVKLCKQAYWYTKDMDVAKDIVQDSWKVIMRKLYRLEDPNRFGSWALTIVRRKTLDTLRKKTKQQQELRNYNENCSPFTAVNDEAKEKEKVIQNIMNAMLSLPANQKEVLTLFYIEEYSLLEITKITGVSLNTIKTRLYRAREKLKVTLKK